MFLILKNIKSTSTVDDIKDFFAPALAGGFLKKTGQVESVQIQQLTNIKTGKVQYNAIVLVMPSSIGARGVKMLNRKPLNGKYINIAEFQIRMHTNDRRTTRYHHSTNRREGDRRQHLEVVDITEQMKPMPGGLQTYNWNNEYGL